MATAPLTVSPETVELQVGGTLRLQLAANARAAGEITWFFEGAPLPGHTGPVCSITAVQARHQGVYRAVVQRGPFGGLEGNVPASVEISEPAFVFVSATPKEPHELPLCAICLSPVPERESFRFRRKAEESYHSGFRVLTDNGTFSAELLYCSHEFHRSCVTSYAEHAILSDGRWCVRCPSMNCNYRLYHTDIKELCGQSSAALTSYVELKTKDFSERVRQVQAGEEVDTETRKWMAENCDVCPGCKAIVYRDAGCKTITCPCEARFTHGEHRLST